MDAPAWAFEPKGIITGPRCMDLTLSDEKETGKVT